VLTILILFTGDEYTKSEFKRHRDADTSYVPVFMKEWAKYASDLSKQLGIRGSHKAQPLGTDLKEESLDYFTEEQLSQLYALYEESKGKSNSTE